MVHNHEARGSGIGEARDLSRPCTLNKDPTFKITKSSFMVPVDMCQPGG
jgi:hypothetical protein